MVGILEKIPGVQSAKVDFDSKIATVECSGAVTAEAVSAAVAESGQFTAAVKN